jgi:hypothetical protein
MFAAGIAEHCGETGGAGGSLHAFPWSHFQTGVKEPEIDALIGGCAGFREIPTGRNAAVVEADSRCVGHVERIAYTMSSAI